MPQTAPDLSVEQEQELIARYRRGESVRVLARAAHRRTAVISDLLARESVPIRFGGTRRRYADDQVADLAARYQAGASLATLAAETGAKVSTVRTTLLRAGIQTRQGGRPAFWTPDRLAWIAERYRAGESQAKIAEQVGVSQRVVSVALRRAGIETRGPRYSREQHPSWKGGRLVTKEGYVLVVPTDDDLTYCVVNSTGYAKEHRLVVGRAIGRRLLRSETVHHVNGDKTDNQIGNLQLRQGNHGAGIVFQCRVCGSHDVTPVPLAE